MLFNSYAFLFLFLPVCFGLFYYCQGKSFTLIVGGLFAASLLFYGLWNPRYVILLLLSITINYGVGIALAHTDLSLKRKRQQILSAGIIFNLCLLGYYKYSDFFIQNINMAFDIQLPVMHMLLPLGISFFTFTQTAFLIDAYQGKAKEYNFIAYGLFVSYFPHLIAGPIIHHAEIVPQFAEAFNKQQRAKQFAVGLSIFAIGLCKKTLLADGVSVYVAPVFNHSDIVSPLGAWLGALAYTFQLYFDFSGYCDMAIGLSTLFGVKLPLNFSSPYKASSIIDFWRTWHMTLSRFLKNYLYFPLGGNRKGPSRRYVNLMITMFLGGLWHGAGWTYIFWGCLHGLYLIINHAFRNFTHAMSGLHFLPHALKRILARILTFLAVMIAWIFFRADNCHIAMTLLRHMFDFQALAFSADLANQFPSAIATFAHKILPLQKVVSFVPDGEIRNLIFLGAVAWLLPNSQQIMRHASPVLDEISLEGVTFYNHWMVWKPKKTWAIGMGALLALSILTFTSSSDFLYFQF